MIFGAFILVMVLIAHLPAPANLILGVAWIAVFPRIYRWARSFW
ncbi:MAG TPA: hypothetical protein VGD30_16285 [Telluria sp.]